MKHIAIQLSSLFATLLPLKAQDSPPLDLILDRINEKLDSAIQNGEIPDDVEMNDEIRKKIAAALQNIEAHDETIAWRAVEVAGTPEGVANPIKYRLGFDVGRGNESASQVWLGVSVSPISSHVAHQLPIPPNTGLVVDAVSEKSAAAIAGITTGDVIAKLDEQILIHPDQLRVLVQNHQAGDEVKLICFREGKPLELSVTLSDLKSTPISTESSTIREVQTLRLDPDNRAFIKLLGQQKQQLETLQRGVRFASKDETQEQLNQLNQQVTEIRQALEKLAEAQKDK